MFSAGAIISTTFFFSHMIVEGLGFLEVKKLVILALPSTFRFFEGEAAAALSSGMLLLSVLIKKFESLTCFPENSLKYLVQVSGGLSEGLTSMSNVARTGQ